MRRARMGYPQPSTIDVVDAIAHALERLAEARSFGVLITPGEWDAGKRPIAIIKLLRRTGYDRYVPGPRGGKVRPLI